MNLTVCPFCFLKQSTCVEQDAEGRANRHPLLFVAVVITSYPSKGRRDCIKRRPRMLFPPISLPSQERRGSKVGFAQKYQEVINNMSVFLSVFFHCPSKAALEKIKKKKLS